VSRNEELELLQANALYAKSVEETSVGEKIRSSGAAARAGAI